MKPIGLLALAAMLAAAATPALARDAYVLDGAGLFSAATVSDLNRKAADFNAQSGKEVVVVTEPSLGGRTALTAAEEAFAKQQVNGVLFYFAKAEKKDVVIGDRASRAFFPAGSFQNIHDAMRGYLRSGDADQAIETGVGLVLDQYRGHLRTTPVRRQAAPAGTSSMGGISLLWLALILLAGFLIIRAIFRAMAAPRAMPPYGGPGAPGGPGYGPGPGYGYGPGYGGGGGGGFFSGLLGGLGGAWLGNELFGGRGGGGAYGGGDVAGMGAGSAGGDAGSDAGWQSDPGQADAGGAGGGGWGDGGGGFDMGGGGFDGGGGGDSGGW